jgi:hypothetical protein
VRFYFSIILKENNKNNGKKVLLAVLDFYSVIFFTVYSDKIIRHVIVRID